MIRCAAITLAVALSFPSPCFSEMLEPGGRAEDAALALTNPDEYAWQVFLFLNHQAIPGVPGVANEQKSSISSYDPDKDVVWETWALASGLDLQQNGADGSTTFVRNISEVYKRPATPPVPWDNLTRRGGTKPSLSPPFKSLAPFVDAVSPRPQRAANPIVAAPIGSSPAEDEVRMNRSTYETVIGNRLYSVEGLESAAQRSRTEGQALLVKFEPSSKEVKARWVRLTNCSPAAACPDKDRYHWRVIPNPTNNVQEVWGLAALHIITKDIPNWFWSDFGHADCETGAGPCSGFVAETRLRDSKTTGPGGVGPKGRDGVRTETLNSKWANYRLRGTQIDFTLSNGVPTVLSNPVIEDTFQTSSCISCHAQASVGIRGSVPDRGSSLPRLLGADHVRNLGSMPPLTEIGSARCDRFLGAGTPGGCGSNAGPQAPVYLQTDFLWSIPFRAFSERP